MIGTWLRSSMTCGEALIRIGYCVSPIFDRPDGHDEVLRHDRVGDVERGQPVALQGLQVEVDHDLPRARRRRVTGSVEPGTCVRVWRMRYWP